MNKATRELPPQRLHADDGARPRLLVVEDEDSLRHALVRNLGGVFDITPVADGAAAAELLVTETYDGVLSDIGLPGMSGVDLLRIVRTYDLDVPVVLMTGQPSVETAVAALELGALTYVQKPFSYDALQATLLRRVRELAAAGFRAPDAGMTLFVNLHPADLLDPDLYDRSAPLSRIADHVVLEITERASLDDITEIEHRASELRGRGFKLAVDDLGAGYAGLTSFAMLEPEVVKLDMSLIRGIERSPVKKRVVASMTRLCRELDMRVVAEGIETMPELACVIDLGCDYVQGYLLGKPGPALVLSAQTW